MCSSIQRTTVPGAASTCGIGPAALAAWGKRLAAEREELEKRLAALEGAQAGDLEAIERLLEEAGRVRASSERLSRYSAVAGDLEPDDVCMVVADPLMMAFRTTDVYRNKLLDHAAH